MAFKVELDGGKYMFVNDNGMVDFYRYGEPSAEFIGSKPILSLLHKLEQQECKLEAIKNVAKRLEYGAILNAYDFYDEVMKIIRDNGEVAE